MNKFRNYARLLAVMLLGLFIFSCNEDDLTNDLSESQISETKVSLDLAKRAALNFTKDEAFIGKPDKEDLKIALRSTKNSKSLPFPGFEERKIEEVIELNGSSGHTSLYVVKFLPNGYIILPSTKKEVPILAFSNNGVFNQNDISQGIQDWIENRSEVVEFLETDNDIEVSEDIQEQWDCVAPPIDDEETVSGGSVHEQTGPLLQTRWGQENGYNNLAPQMGCSRPTNGRAYTGCVATAMAQVMRYHKYPNNYNWSIMPNKIYSSTPSNSSVMEVAKLLRDVGQSVNMQYSCEGSGAYTSNAKNALVNTFGYSSYASYVNFNTNTIVQQLGMWNQPVILRGQDSSAGGHAWVCDGYKRIKYTTIHNPGTYYEYETYTFSNFYLHMNWGWNDSFNTDSNWFFHGTPDVGWANFSTGYKMIINIHP
jgi:streptopain